MGLCTGGDSRSVVSWAGALSAEMRFIACSPSCTYEGGAIASSGEQYPLPCSHFLACPVYLAFHFFPPSSLSAPPFLLFQQQHQCVLVTQQSLLNHADAADRKK